MRRHHVPHVAHNIKTWLSVVGKDDLIATLHVKLDIYQWGGYKCPSASGTLRRTSSDLNIRIRVLTMRGAVSERPDVTWDMERERTIFCPPLPMTTQHLTHLCGLKAYLHIRLI